MKLEKERIEELAVKYDSPVEFVNELHEKVVDKGNFERALKMFMYGSLPYDVATGKEPINVAEIRSKIASDLLEYRKRVKAEIERKHKTVEYYNGCKTLPYPRKPKNGCQDVVFIKGGHLVAFARFESKDGGFYAANNEVMPEYNWNPHKHLARLRRMNKAFYREVKKAAFADPKEWFNFTANQRGADPLR